MKWNWIGVGDWELFVTMAAVPQKTILHFHQFPFWNPYLGGGDILFHHPEVGILSPFFLLILILGPIAGIKIQMLLSYFLGFYGTYLFARKLGLSEISSYLTAFVYFGSSYFALHFAIGHVPFTHFCFLPWFLYLVLKTETSWVYFLAASICIALIILGNGAAVPFLYTAFFSGLFFLLYSVEIRQWRFFKNYLISIFTGLLLAAVKAAPMFYHLSQIRWEGMTEDATPLNFVFDAFLSFDQAIFKTVKTAEHWGWHEYSAYISPLVIILAVIGLIYSFRKCRIWLILAVFFFIFGLGHFASLSPWNIITQLPGFSSIRSPARAFQFVILATAVMSAIGLDNIFQREGMSDKAKSIMALLLAVIVLGGNFLINLPALNSIAYKKPRTRTFADEFRHVVGNKYEIYDLFLQNRGSLVAPWLSAYRESRAIVTPDNQVMMEYVIQGQMNVVERNYTPNRVEYKIMPASSGQMIIGVGYDEGWYAQDGRAVSENSKLVGINFDKSDKNIILRYRPPYFYIGLIITLLSLTGLALVYFNSQFGKRCKAILD